MRAHREVPSGVSHENLCAEESRFTFHERSPVAGCHMHAMLDCHVLNMHVLAASRTPNRLTLLR